MRAHTLAAALAAAVAWGCASSGSSSSTSGGLTASAGGSGIAAAAVPRGGRDVITEAEIASRASGASNAFEVIQKLRPQMLQSRGVTSPRDSTGATSRPKVFVDNIEYGDVSALANLHATQIKEIRFLSSRDATTQWGTGFTGGVILITTKR